MVDGLALCSCACVTCLWCSLLALCFPKLLKKIQESDSSICCAVKPKNPTSVQIENRRTSIDETINNKSPMRCNGYRNRPYEPKCTVKIVRKTKRSSPRRDISEKEDENGNNSIWQDNSDNICTAAYPKDRKARYCTVACSNPKNSGVQTDLFRRRRRSGFPENLESSDNEMDRKRRYKVNAKLTRRQFSSSDECIRSRGGGQSMKKTTKRFPHLFSTRYGSSVVHDRDEIRRIY